MTETRKPLINPVVVLREEFDDWAVLFNPDTAEAVGINPIGVVIWKLLNGDRHVTAIVEALHNHFSAIPETAADDVLAFVEHLADRGFVGYEVKEAPQ